MIISRTTITQFIILWSVFFITDCLGFYSIDNLILGGIPLRDISVLLVIFYFAFTIKENQKKYSFLAFPIWIYAGLATLVILSMPLRGDISLMQSFKVGRHFYILLLAVVIADDIYYRKNLNFILKVVFFLGVYYSIIAIINNIFPDVVTQIWKGIGTHTGVKGETVRNVIKSNKGILFIHLSFVIKALQVLTNKKYRNNKNYIALVFFTVCVFLMGFRAIMLTTFFSFLVAAIVLLKPLRKARLINDKKLIWSVVLALGLVIVANIMLNNAVFGMFSYTMRELTGEVDARAGGTLDGRLTRSANYQLLIAKEHPFFGVGFVHKSSPMAEKFGYQIEDLNVDGSHSLYYFDFGYGTLWIMFGLIGLAFILFGLVYSLVYIIKTNRKRFSIYYIQYCVICVSFIVCNYSFAVLVYDTGLIILAFSLGIAMGCKRIADKRLSKVIFKQIPHFVRNDDSSCRGISGSSGGEAAATSTLTLPRKGVISKEQSD